jgi:hypothetical protein
LASVGSNLVWVFIIVGAMLNSFGLILAGIGLFAAFVVFNLVNLPVEFNASSRARRALADGGIVTPGEDAVVAGVLNAAALTYVAATVTAILQLAYFVLRYGGVGRRD